MVENNRNQLFDGTKTMQLFLKIHNHTTIFVSKSICILTKHTLIDTTSQDPHIFIEEILYHH